MVEVVEGREDESPPVEMAAVSAYKDDGEFLKEQLEWLDQSIALRLYIQQQLETEVELADPDGEELANVQLFERMNAAIVHSKYDKRALRYMERIAGIERHIEARLQASEMMGLRLTIPYLSRIYGLSSTELKAVIVCLAVEVDRKYESAYELLQLDGGTRGKYPTVGLVSTLISLTAQQQQQAIQVFNERGSLRRYFLQKPDTPSRAGSTLSQSLQLDERMVRFILESRELAPSMEHYAKLIRPTELSTSLLGNSEVQRKLRLWISNRLSQPDQAAASLLISLWGKMGSGKKTHLTHLCHYFGEPLLLIDLEKMWGETTDVPAMLEKMFREATLQQAVLVLCNFHILLGASERGRTGHAVNVLDEIVDRSGIVFLLSEEPCQTVDRKHCIDLEIEIAPLEDEERAVVWQQLAQDYDVEVPIDWEALSARFQFNPGQMVHALRSARTIVEWNRDEHHSKSIGWHELIQACYKQLNHTLGSKSKLLSPKDSWEDLILPMAQREKLQHACNHIQYKHTVYGRWGFNKKLSYGTGISLLFSGPPGTGKTMAAEIVAKELDMEIYKIDLSQIISKYIGETEKNLKEIFDEAQASYAVLFFDEADALFGKRSEVKDSHDKHANTEVAFLLQKMEEYRGISILATNYLQNMDEAFLRRINYVIRFPFPDEQQRELIWQHIYPRQTPLEKDIDFGFLARKLQMAGGSIKNMALTSAFLASGRGEKVGMKHIFKAYQYELDKTNRALTRDDLGEYAYLYEALLIL
jgi:AAA+ superfamily predicted ATPase